MHGWRHQNSQSSNKYDCFLFIAKHSNVWFLVIAQRNISYRNLYEQNHLDWKKRIEVIRSCVVRNQRKRNQNSRDFQAKQSANIATTNSWSPPFGLSTYGLESSSKINVKTQWAMPCSKQRPFQLWWIRQNFRRQNSTHLQPAQIQQTPQTLTTLRCDWKYLNWMQMHQQLFW